MTDNNEYDGYTKGLIEAIISAANDRSVTFDTLKSKTPVDFLPKKFDGIFPRFLMKIGFTPDGSVLAQSTNDYFYNSIDDVKKIDEKGMYLEWKMKLKEKSNQNILDELTIFDINWIGGKNGEKFISQFLIYIAFELLQYSKNKDWKSCIVKSINTNPENKELKQLEQKSSINEVEKSNENVPLKNPKEYHPIHNGRLFIGDLFLRIRKYIQKALYAVDPQKEHGILNSMKQKIRHTQKEPLNNENTTNLINAFKTIDELRKKLLNTIQQFTSNKVKEWERRYTTLGVLSLPEYKHHFFDSAFKREYLLNLMKSPQINASANIQLKYLENLLKNEDLTDEPHDSHYGFHDIFHRSKMRAFLIENEILENDDVTNPLHQGGRKTRKRRNIRVKSRRYY